MAETDSSDIPKSITLSIESDGPEAVAYKLMEKALSSCNDATSVTTISSLLKLYKRCLDTVKETDDEFSV